MNLVMSNLSTYLEYYSKEDDYRLKILEGDTENGLGEFYDPEDNQIAYRGYIKNKIINKEIERAEDENNISKLNPQSRREKILNVTKAASHASARV